MEDMLKNLTVYKAVRPDKSSLWITAVIFLVFSIPMAFGGLGIMTSGNEEGIILLFVGVMMVAILPFVLRKDKYMLRKREIRFAQFTAEDFLRLEDELQKAPARYDSFHFLEEYLFVPQAGVLLRYEEILHITVVVRKTNMITQGATMYFTCPDATYEAMLIGWKSYLHYPAAFERELNAKRPLSNPVQISQKTEHNVHVPHISS